MRAGTLRHTLLIYSPPVDTTPDKYGQPNDAAVLLDTVRAEIMPLRGREWFDAREHQSNVTHKIRLRYLAGVTTKCYGVDENSIEYDFDEVLDDGYRGRWLTIMATQRDVDGG